MFTADTHADTLYALKLRGAAPDRLMITPEKLRQGGVTLQTLALFTGGATEEAEAESNVLQELQALPFFLEAGFRQVLSPQEASADHPGILLSMEGGEALSASDEKVSFWHERKVRMVALLWNHPNALGFPAKGGFTQGLTPEGIARARKMQQLHMAVDVSHLNEAGFWDLYRYTFRPPMASHSCCSALCGHPRNLTDEQILQMIRCGGYIGVNFCPAFLDEGEDADLETVARHILHICDLGGEDIVGLGSDFDGIARTPRGLSGPQDLPALFDVLRAHGMEETQIRKVAGENFTAYFRRISS